MATSPFFISPAGDQIGAGLSSLGMILRANKEEREAREAEAAKAERQRAMMSGAWEAMQSKDPSKWAELVETYPEAAEMAMKGMGATEEWQRKEMAQDALKVLSNPSNALQELDRRIATGEAAQRDMTHSRELRDLLASGDTEGAMKEAEAALIFSDLDTWKAWREANPREEIIPASSVTDSGQVIVRSPDGRMRTVTPEGLTLEADEGYEILTPDEAQQWGLPPGPVYQVNRETNQVAQVGGAGVTVNNIQGAENSYLQGRAGQQATAMGELEKGAESAFRANMALDRFLASSPEGDAGGAQPVLTGVKNLLSSFGFDPAGLTDTAQMQQAIGDILGQKMAELGARGLTDRDMDVLRQALPRVNTSKEARQNVADIIKKANEATLNEYINQVKWEEQNYPDFTFRRPSWLNEYRANIDAGNQDDPLGILK